MVGNHHHIGTARASEIFVGRIQSVSSELQTDNMDKAHFVATDWRLNRVFQSGAPAAIAVKGNDRGLFYAAAGGKAIECLIAPDIAALQVEMIRITTAHFVAP